MSISDQASESTKGLPRIVVCEVMRLVLGLFSSCV